MGESNRDGYSGPPEGVTPEWRSVVGYPKYEVSSDGRIKSYKRSVPIVLKPYRNAVNGYYTVVLSDDDYLRRTLPIHRIVATAFHGLPSEGFEVRHIDGDKENNSAANLRWGSHAENVRDIIRHGNHNFASATHCKQGHLYDEENAIWYIASDTKRWRRRCRACNVVWTIEANERRRQRRKGTK